MSWPLIALPVIALAVVLYTEIRRGDNTVKPHLLTWA